jgi:hypothetical protein
MNSELLDGGAVALGFPNRYECALALLATGFGSTAVSEVTALSPEAIRALFDAVRGEGEIEAGSLGALLEQKIAWAD